MPIKFSQFTNRTSTTAGTTIVGFDGNQNIKILSSDLVSGFINGTTHTLPVFTTANTLGDSIVAQDASATQLFVNGKVGIGRTLLPGGPNLEVYSTGNPFADIRSVQAGGSVSQGARIYLTAEDTVANKQGQVDINIHGPSHSTEAYSFEIANISNPTPTTGGDIFFSSRPAGSTIELVRFKEDGKVGIGTDAPATKLHIADTTTPTIRIEDTTNGKHLQLFTDNNSSYIRSSASTPIYVQTDGANTRMLISSGGNVGINSTDFTTTYGSVPDLRVGSVSGVGNPGVIDILRKDGDVQAGETTGILQFSVDDDQNYCNAQIEVESNATAQSGNSGGGILKFKTTDSQSGATPTEHMRITNDGNVGIGTTSPGGLLHVSSGTSGDAIVIIESDTDDNDNSDNPHLEFRQDGNTIRGKIGLEGTAGQTYSNSVANATYLGSVFQQPLQFITGDTGGVQTAKMTIQPDTGYVGIGTTTPTSKLQVSDGGIQTRLNYVSGSDTYMAYVQADSGSVDTSLYIARGGSGGQQSAIEFYEDSTGTYRDNKMTFKLTQPNSYNVQEYMRFQYSTATTGLVNIQAYKPIVAMEGVYIGASSNFNQAPHHLDDYEEGSFTPTFVGTSGLAITYDTQVGRYVKVGRVVHAFVELGSDAVTYASGNLEINGLPFAADDVDGAATVGLNYSFATSLANYTFSINENNSKINIYLRNATTQYPASGLGTGTNANRLRLTMTYLTTT